MTFRNFHTTFHVASMRADEARRQRTKIRDITAGSLQFTLVPSMILGSEAEVLDFNVACSELFGEHLWGIKRQPWSSFHERLSSQDLADVLQIGVPAESADESVLPIAELRASALDFPYESVCFGRANVRVVAIPQVDLVTGSPAGWLVQYELLTLDDRTRFREAVFLRWRHELMWDVYSSCYDRLLPELPFYQEAVQRHHSAMSAPEIHSVVDIGAGTGSVTLPLLRDGKEVTAVDIRSAMLCKLIDKIDENIEDRLQVVEDSAERLPALAGEQFDGATALLALYDMKKPFAALDEMVRLLKPGGTLIITEPKRDFSVEPLMVEAERAFREKGVWELVQLDWMRIQRIKEALAETVHRVATSDDQFPRNRRWTAETAFARLQELRFVDLEIGTSYHGTSATVTGTKPH